MTAAENRTCIITLPLSDFKSQACLTLSHRQYEITNENVSYFSINQSKTKTFTDLKISTNLYNRLNQLKIALTLMEIPAHFIQEIKTKGYDFTGVNVFLRKLMRLPRKKRSKTSLLLILLNRDGGDAWISYSFKRTRESSSRSWKGSLRHVLRAQAIGQKLKEEIIHKEEHCKRAHGYKTNWKWLNG